MNAITGNHRTVNDNLTARMSDALATGWLAEALIVVGVMMMVAFMIN